MSESAVGQLWPSVFGHSEWMHLVSFVMADEEDVCVKIRQRCVIECCVKLMNESVMKHLKCYGKHMVVKHLAVLQCSVVEALQRR